MMDWTVGWNPGSLEELTRMAGFSALLDPEITAALARAGEMLVTTAQRNAWEVFDTHPTEILENSIYFRVVSPSEIAVAVGAPWGARREWGFSGKTDSLGRYYVNDPGKPYLTPALIEDEPLVANLIEYACYNAMGRLVVAGA